MAFNILQYRHEQLAKTRSRFGHGTQMSFLIEFLVQYLMNAPLFLPIQLYLRLVVRDRIRDPSQ